MLSDSKIREAGFIRNSSSRKIIYHPQPQHQKHSSDDSFSSFQYESTSKVSIQSGSKSLTKNDESIRKSYSREKPQQRYESGKKQGIRTIVPQIPKPTKKAQPQFHNKRLKNNFFQQPQKKASQKIEALKQQMPRMNTPYFMESSVKEDLEEVNNICNRIENMKLEGNFSFNPKINNKGMKERRLEGKLNEDREIESPKIAKNENKRTMVNQSWAKPQNEANPIVRKPKQNNYFSNSNNQGNRFQYDFESSDNQAEQSESSSYTSSQEQMSYEGQQDEVMRYYQQQQRQRTEPQVMLRTQPKAISPNNYINHGRISNLQNPHYAQQLQNQCHLHKVNPLHTRKVQNQESSQNGEQLITDYNKDDFAMNIPTYMKVKNQKLAQNKAYHNMAGSEPQEGMIATNGGVCFSVDVKQFSQNSSAVVSHPTRKPNPNPKKKKTNNREEMLKRRQMAKVYSKQARFRLFGFA